jgi:hypothetical protein
MDRAIHEAHKQNQDLYTCCEFQAVDRRLRGVGLMKG